MNDERMARLQEQLRERQISGWLFYDFRRSNPIAYRVLDFAHHLWFSRRWFYWLPAEGEPVKLVGAVEPNHLDELPGRKMVCRDRQELVAGLVEALAGATTVAMEYSPLGELPVIAKVDAGTVELIASLGKTVVSSADLLQAIEAPISAEQFAGHLEAERRLGLIMQATQEHIRAALRDGVALDEFGLVEFMRELYRQHDLEYGDGPHTAVNANASDPHYEPSASKSAPVRAGDLLLIDWWGKLKDQGAVFADYTWMLMVGASVPAHYTEIFAVVTGARDAAIDFIARNVEAGTPIQGWQVDDAARNYIVARGYGDYFVHRTGHSIREEIHGAGANMDNFETRDTRAILPNTLFSIEPGIYLPEFGFRSEVNVFIGDGEIVVTGRPLQQSIAVLA